MLSTSLPAASSGPKAVPPQRFVAPEAQGGIASASASATRPRSPAGPFICTASPVGARSRSPASFIAAPEVPDRLDAPLARGASSRGPQVLDGRPEAILAILRSAGSASPDPLLGEV